MLCLITLGSMSTSTALATRSVDNKSNTCQVRPNKAEVDYLFIYGWHLPPCAVRRKKRSQQAEPYTFPSEPSPQMTSNSSWPTWLPHWPSCTVTTDMIRPDAGRPRTRERSNSDKDQTESVYLEERQVITSCRQTLSTYVVTFKPSPRCRHNLLEGHFRGSVSK